jgi:hypothetical protein
MKFHVRLTSFIAFTTRKYYVFVDSWNMCLKHGSLCISGFEKIFSWGQGGTATKYVNVYVEECDAT